MSFCFRFDIVYILYLYQEKVVDEIELKSESWDKQKCHFDLEAILS